MLSKWYSPVTKSFYAVYIYEMSSMWYLYYHHIFDICIWNLFLCGSSAYLKGFCAHKKRLMSDYNSLASCCYTCSHACCCNYVESRFLWHVHLAAVVSVGAALFLFQQLAGINAVVYYSTSVFRSAGIASDVAASALVGASNVFGNPF